MIDEQDNPRNIETNCDKCGKSISLKEHTENKGLCDDCVININ